MRAEHRGTHASHISTSPPLHRSPSLPLAHLSPTSRPPLAYTSRLPLAYLSPTSRLPLAYLAYLSPTSRLSPSRLAAAADAGDGAAMGTAVDKRAARKRAAPGD